MKIREDKKTMRMGVFSDTHCGHVAGLTPPDWWQSTNRPWGRNQRAMWNWFTKRAKVRGPYDVAVWNGDLIDGPGFKSQGSEHIVTTESQQLEMAQQIIEFVGAPINLVVFGTAYHTGIANDFEELLAKSMKIECGERGFVDINGCTFDFRHHTSKSSIPYGMSAVAKEKMHDIITYFLNEKRGARRPAMNYVRSHVHEYTNKPFLDGDNITTPALQGPGSKFGRRCSGQYHVGFVVIDIDKKGKKICEAEIANIQRNPGHVTLKL